MKLNEMSIEQLRSAILRCRDRLSGAMPLGVMGTKERVRQALIQYKTELLRREYNVIDFK